MKFLSKDTIVVARDGKRHFATVTATKVESGEPMLHVLLWASGEDITKQLADEQRAALIQELFRPK